MAITPVERQQMRSSWVSMAISLAVYSAISGALVLFVDGGKNSFWWVMGTIAALRVSFAVIDFSVGVAVWRLYGRRVAVNNYLAAMREAKMPYRVYRHDDAGNYLARLGNDCRFHEVELSPEATTLAQELERTMATVRDTHGMMAETRTWDAINRALNLYSPPEASPPSGNHGVLSWVRTASREALLGLPGATASLVDGLRRDRPFATVGEFWAYLRAHGLSDEIAVRLFVAAGCLSEGQPDTVSAREGTAIAR